MFNILGILAMFVVLLYVGSGLINPNFFEEIRTQNQTIATMSEKKSMQDDKILVDDKITISNNSIKLNKLLLDIDNKNSDSSKGITIEFYSPENIFLKDEEYVQVTGTQNVPGTPKDVYLGDKHVDVNTSSVMDIDKTYDYTNSNDEDKTQQYLYFTRKGSADGVGITKLTIVGSGKIALEFDKFVFFKIIKDKDVEIKNLKNIYGYKNFSIDNTYL